MTPAGERLNACELEGARVELRLKEGNELAALEPRHDAVGGLLVAHHLGLHRLGEEFRTVAAEALGAVERDVGVDEQALTVDRGAESAGDADAHAEAAFVTIIGSRLADRLDEPVGEVAEPLHPHVGVADDHEFVAAGARDEIALAKARADRLRGMDEHRVARRMAERVVDLLEAIEVDVEDDDALAGRRATRCALLEHPLEVHAIRQLGQKVMQRIVLDARARRFEFDVARLRQRLRARQVLGQRDVGGDVPIEADHLLGSVGGDIDGPDLADHPSAAVAEDQRIL